MVLLGKKSEKSGFIRKKMKAKLFFFNGKTSYKDDVAENIFSFKLVDPSSVFKGKISFFDYLDENGPKKTLLEIKQMEYFADQPLSMLGGEVTDYQRLFVEVDPFGKCGWVTDGDGEPMMVTIQ